MSVFKFRALDSQGVAQNGTLQAQDQAAAIAILHKRGLLLLQILLGFFAIDVDGMESGPFAYLVSFDSGRWAAETHELVFNLLLAVIALHIMAMVFYRMVRGENLVAAMITGWQRWTGTAPVLRFTSPLLALIVLIACGLLVWAVVGLFGGA